MSRYDESIGPVPNPSQFYLEWNSELNAFSFWEKESESRRPCPLPFRFAALKFMNSVTGFDENKRMGIYSNEVADTRNEPLRVLYRDGSPLAQGTYAQIKDQVNHYGGRFTRSIYACTPKGVIVNIKLKGSQMINFGVIEKFGKRWQDEWIEVASFETRQNQNEDGKEYSVPVFSFAKSFNTQEIEMTGKSYEIVKHYFQSKAPVHFTQQQSPVPSEPATTPFQILDDDDLPF